MKYMLIAVLLISPVSISAEVYKCKQVGGKLSFSDRPCPKNADEEKIVVENKNGDWVDRLRQEKSSVIKIIDVQRKDGDVTIKYEFITKSGSNEFIRLAGNLSDMRVMLMRYIEPNENGPGRAEIKASNKPNPLFDKLNGAKN